MESILNLQCLLSLFYFWFEHYPHARLLLPPWSPQVTVALDICKLCLLEIKMYAENMTFVK